VSFRNGTSCLEDLTRAAIFVPVLAQRLHNDLATQFFAILLADGRLTGSWNLTLFV
jgi:hypothetical protein